jgi:hypothetical protein
MRLKHSLTLAQHAPSSLRLSQIVSDFFGFDVQMRNTQIAAFEEVDVTEAVMVEILGRETAILPMVLGEHVLLGVTVLEELDLTVDGKRNRLVPYQGTQDQPVFRV